MTKWTWFGEFGDLCDADDTDESSETPTLHDGPLLEQSRQFLFGIASMADENSLLAEANLPNIIWQTPLICNLFVF